MEGIFRADVAELRSRGGRPKGILRIPDSDIDVAEVGAKLHALVQLAGPVPGLAQQEIVGSFPAREERFVRTAGDLEGIDQNDGLLVHWSQLLDYWHSRIVTTACIITRY